MTAIQPLKAELLCHNCDPEQFTFTTTAELPLLEDVIGQERAVEALRFGIGIQREGYNLFAMGPQGTGKHSAIDRFLTQVANQATTPADWCYVNNFNQPHKPNALKLPSGQGHILCGDMEALVEELHIVIPTAFESEEYEAQEKALLDALKQRQEETFNALQEQAQAQGLALVRVQTGWGFAPMQEGQVVSPEAFQQLPQEDRERLQKAGQVLDEALQETLEQVRIWEGEQREQIKTLHEALMTKVVGSLINKLRKKYSDQPDILAYLDAVQEDIVTHANDFRQQAPAAAPPLADAPLPRAAQGPPSFRRYQVNILVNHAKTEGCPVVYEDNPTYQRLFGQIEHTIAQAGALVTDFNLIKAGALHQANGGYLIVDAHKLLQQPYAWEQLKRALRAQHIMMETPIQSQGLATTISLTPQPVPLSIKIVLLGNRMVYYQLHQLDPDFGELFKVVVDFAETMERTTDNSLLYARLVATLAEKEGLRHLDRAAVARVIEHSSRLADHTEKLSTRMQGVADLIREADYWAGSNGKEVIGVADIQQAIDSQIYRVDRVREQAQEQIEDHTILIDTDGAKVGQINGLSVLSIGNFAFGRPSRITARIRPGKGEVIDIEREVELSGPLHAKGVLILSSYLGSRYAPDRPLSLTASLVFEQSYGGVDGDSASSTELYALLSALSGVPIKQSFAVTGSVNQYGQVQAIGGVNEKIEGFFDLCRVRGLTGEQGVLIPISNVKHLMLRQDVIEAVQAEQFHLYSIETIDQGIEVLTGVPAGERDTSGQFPEGSINALVEARLIALAEARRAYQLD
ncbi:MAG: ATP-binding protein [Chloroflexota bacterium]